MIELTVHPSTILVTGGDDAFDEALEKILTVSVKDGKEYKRRSLVKISSGGALVPRGHQKKLKKWLKAIGAETQTRKAYTPCEVDLGVLSGLRIPLYPHQQEAVERLLSFEMGIMSAPTASGKGNMAVALAMCIKGKVGIFTKSTRLVADLRERMQKVAGEEAGCFSASAQVEKRVSVFGADWISSKVSSKDKHVLKLLASLDAIIVDECHGWATDLKERVLMRCTGAARRYGLSGTALDRSDGRTPVMTGQLGPVTASIQHSLLREIGAVPEETVVMVLFEHTDPQERNSYSDFYAANIYNNKRRNRLVADLLGVVDLPCMVFAERQQHISINEKICRKLRLDVEVAYGPVKDLNRARAFSRAAKGDLEVLVGSRVAFTGVDMPGLRSGIMTDAGRAVITLIQKIGRIMRNDKGKPHFEFIDIGDIWPYKNAEGEPLAFESQARDRWRTYVDKGYRVVFKVFSNGQLVEAENPWA